MTHGVEGSICFFHARCIGHIAILSHANYVNEKAVLLSSSCPAPTLHSNSEYDLSTLQGYSYPQKFIASQGPKPETVADFWRMIIEQKCRVIAMLTRLVEKRKVSFAFVQELFEDE